MAVIQSKDLGVDAIGHEGVQYQTQGDGLFEVPHDVAVHLVKVSPNFRMYDGLPWPHPKTPEEIEAERLAGAIKQVLAAQEPAPAPTKPDRLAAARAALARKKQGAKKS